MAWVCIYSTVCFQAVSGCMRLTVTYWGWASLLAYCLEPDDVPDVQCRDESGKPKFPAWWYIPNRRFQFRVWVFRITDSSLVQCLARVYATTLEVSGQEFFSVRARPCPTRSGSGLFFLNLGQNGSVQAAKKLCPLISKVECHKPPIITIHRRLTNQIHYSQTV